MGLRRILAISGLASILAFSGCENKRTPASQPYTDNPAIAVYERVQKNAERTGIREYKFAIDNKPVRAELTKTHLIIYIGETKIKYLGSEIGNYSRLEVCSGNATIDDNSGELIRHAKKLAEQSVPEIEKLQLAELAKAKKQARKDLGLE